MRSVRRKPQKHRDFTVASRFTKLVTICVLLGSFFVAALGGEPDISADRIHDYLTSKSSPLEVAAQTFVDEGKIWNVDPRLIIAIAGAETGFGLRICGDFNAWNWFHALSSCRNCTTRELCAKSAFMSWQRGVGQVTKFMRKSYFDRDLTTIPQIEMQYCKANCGDWIRLVKRFDGDELGGDTNALTFQH